MEVNVMLFILEVVLVALFVTAQFIISMWLINSIVHRWERRRVGLRFEYALKRQVAQVLLPPKR